MVDDCMQKFGGDILKKFLGRRPKIMEGKTYDGVQNDGYVM
jgi:hypothetical protein